MNKTQVVASVAEKTGLKLDVCQTVMDALEETSGNVLFARMKGVRLDESAAVDEIAQTAGISQDECKKILGAFEETFGEAISSKFRFFKK